VGNKITSKPGIRSLFRAMDPTIRLLLVIGFLESTGFIFYTSVLMPYYRSLGYGPEAVGILDSILQVVSAITFTVAGFAADRLGRKNKALEGLINERIKPHLEAFLGRDAGREAGFESEARTDTRERAGTQSEPDARADAEAAAVLADDPRRTRQDQHPLH
jgi:hypothetical protein